MRILVALDGSRSSLGARDLVAGLAWPAGTTIRLIGVYTTPIAWVTNGIVPVDWSTEATAALRRETEEMLAAMAAPLEGPGRSIERRAVEGRPATTIIAEANELDADLIVVGSRGYGPIRSLLLGSVSAEVVAGTSRSVLVARRPIVSRVLVATDGSDCASAVPDVLASWGVLDGLEATALSVVPETSPTFDLLVGLYTMSGTTLDEWRAETRIAYQALADGVAARLTEIGVDAHGTVRAGDPAHEILTAAAELGCDLIVTGSRGLHGLDAWFLGSVARNVVVRSDASVLIVRPAVEPAISGEG
jgi:nucleotide-binding universal stress UspA family protein